MVPEDLQHSFKVLLHHSTLCHTRFHEQGHLSSPSWLSRGSGVPASHSSLRTHAAEASAVKCFKADGWCLDPNLCPEHLLTLPLLPKPWRWLFPCCSPSYSKVPPGEGQVLCPSVGASNCQLVITIKLSICLPVY